MAQLLAAWTHLLAALLFGALTLWQLRGWKGDALHRPLVSAFAATCVWSIFMGLIGPATVLSVLAESARNLCFLCFLYGILQTGREARGQRQGLTLIFAALAAVLGLQIVVGALLPGFAERPALHAGLLTAGHLFGLIVAAGMLVLLHNLYGQAAPAARSSLRLPLAALGAIYAYDLHLYTIAWLLPQAAGELFAMRGAVAVLTVPVFALGLRHGPTWRVSLSRAATFRSLSLLGVLLYLVGMMIAARAIEVTGGEWVRIAQLALLVLMSALAAVLLPSPRARAWARVMAAKHLFEHRYDYRAEWLRFTRTVAAQGGGGDAIEERLVRGLAELAGAQAALLLLCEHGRLVPSAGWKWPLSLDRDDQDGTEEAFCRFLASSSHVLDFGALARGQQPDGTLPPSWLAQLPGAWAGVPLVHNGQLLGVVVLAPPLMPRPLDWEDFDLFRAAGMQGASYLAEARGQRALAESQRFDEFNRRFAFICHDIKNLVSQLSLVARNAERHADKPEFRADMIATLQCSVRKMNDLLGRLSHGSAGPSEPPRPLAVRPLLAAVAKGRTRSHPVELYGDPALAVFADGARLEQALAHLLQNAIEASAPGAPVLLGARAAGSQVVLEVRDTGRGMTPEFVRQRLFQPFFSSKSGGFGIGAYEAQALIQAMGGRLEVASQEGAGTTFSIILPAAAALAATPKERKRA